MEGSAIPLVGKAERFDDMADTRHLEKRAGRDTWEVVVEVPRPLRPIVGRKRLRKSTRTSNLKEAQQRRPYIEAELHKSIQAARKQASDDQRERWRFFKDLAFDIREKGSGDDPNALGPTPYADPSEIAELEVAPELGVKRAQEFVQIAQGHVTKVGDLVEDWLQEVAATDKTKTEYRGAVREFLDHHGGDVAAETITRRGAGDYVREHLQQRGLRPQAINRKISALSNFWDWLVRRGFARSNPWTNQRVPTRSDNRGKGKSDTGERPFTDQEVRALLNQAGSATMRDFLLLLLLSGMRREEAAQLRVQDVQAGVFSIREGKSHTAIRSIPIHPDLTDLVGRRTRQKAAHEYLFDELRENTNGRSDALGKKFGRLRRQLNITDPGAGRRERVNMHSARRWFITKAEQAGHPLERIGVVVGHSHARPSVTSAYSGGPSWAQLTDIVECVSLPDLDGN